MGIRSAVGSPILVEGSLWGAILAGSTLEEPLPADTEARLASFTELVATAIANTNSRAALGRLAEEQAALRRVATLVARATPPAQVFAAVAEEVGRSWRSTSRSWSATTRRTHSRSSAPGPERERRRRPRSAAGCRSAAGT